MGNCITHCNNISPQNQITNYNQERTAKMKHGMRRIARARPVSDQSKREGNGRKKMVRFKLHDQESQNGDSKDGNGVVRIKVVMSKEQLKHILKDGKELQKVGSELKIIYRKRTEDGITEGGSHQGRSWRPVLERIPE